MFSKPKPLPEQIAQPAAKNRDTVRSGNHTFSMIASDVDIVGNVKATIDLHIDGNIHGDVTCGSLVQGENSKIIGKLVVENARLSGKVEGSIEARELIIDASAQITGDVIYQNLSIAPGAQVDGKFKQRTAAAPNIGKSTIDIGRADPLMAAKPAQLAGQ